MLETAAALQYYQQDWKHVSIMVLAVRYWHWHAVFYQYCRLTTNMAVKYHKYLYCYAYANLVHN